MRISGVFGPTYRSMLNLPSRLCHAASRGHEPDFSERFGGVPFAGDTFDITYAPDVAEAIRSLHLAQTLAHTVYNIGRAETVTAADLLDAVRAAKPGFDATLQDGTQRHATAPTPASTTSASPPRPAGAPPTPSPPPSPTTSPGSTPARNSKRCHSPRPTSSFLRRQEPRSPYPSFPHFPPSSRTSPRHSREGRNPACPPGHPPPLSVMLSGAQHDTVGAQYGGGLEPREKGDEAADHGCPNASDEQQHGVAEGVHLRAKAAHLLAESVVAPVHLLCEVGQASVDLLVCAFEAAEAFYRIAGVNGWSSVSHTADCTTPSQADRSLLVPHAERTEPLTLSMLSRSRSTSATRTLPILARRVSRRREPRNPCHVECSAAQSKHLVGCPLALEGTRSSRASPSGASERWHPVGRTPPFTLAAPTW